MVCEQQLFFLIIPVVVYIPLHVLSIFSRTKLKREDFMLFQQKSVSTMVAIICILLKLFSVLYYLLSVLCYKLFCLEVWRQYSVCVRRRERLLDLDSDSWFTLVVMVRCGGSLFWLWVSGIKSECGRLKI